MSETDHSDIVAVVSCGWRKANEYLEHGYILLHISEWADERAMNPIRLADGRTQARSYVRKGMTLLLGRKASTPAFNPVESEPPAES